MQEYTTLLGYSKPNMVFVEGHIEDLGAAGVSEGSIDLIISNCVINLCPNKDRVFREAYRALAPGGEMYFSDMYATRRLPASVQTNPVRAQSAVDWAVLSTAICCSALLPLVGPHKGCYI